MKNRKIQIAVVLGGALILYFVAGALVPDETRIRWKVEEAVELFNEGRRSCLDILADDYRDETTKMPKNAIQAYLLNVFIRQQNRKDGDFRYPAAIAGDTLRIEVKEDARTADVGATVEFRERGREDRGVLWTIEVESAWTEESGEWLVRTTDFRIVSGRQPF